MRREELAELHYITPIANVPSICAHGVLSHKRAKKVEHESVSMQLIQDRRARVVVPGGRPLHDYVNLYFDARNPMMFVRKDNHMALCVLRVSPDVLDLHGVVVSDCNASREYARFKPAPNGLAIVDRDLVFAEYWTHLDDPIKEYRHKGVKCAEVLVPDRIEPRFIVGTYVSCPGSRDALMGMFAGATGVEVVVNGHLFFI